MLKITVEKCCFSQDAHEDSKAVTKAAAMKGDLYVFFPSLVLCNLLCGAMVCLWGSFSSYVIRPLPFFLFLILEMENSSKNLFSIFKIYDWLDFLKEEKAA